MSVKVSMKRNWQSNLTSGINRGLLELSTDINRRAVILAPVDTGALRNSGRVNKIGALAYQIVFGSGRVPYARRRHFENRKNPASMGYLAKAADGVARGNISKYFVGKI